MKNLKFWPTICCARCSALVAQLDDRTLVLAALQQYGLSPSPAEVDALVATYPLVRAEMARLYAVDEARYEDPALTYDPR